MSLHDAKEALKRLLPMIADGTLPYAEAEALWAARDAAEAEADHAMVVDIRALFCLWDGTPLQTVLDFLRREARRPDPDVKLPARVAVLHRRDSRRLLIVAVTPPDAPDRAPTWKVRL